ncbi:MAG: glycoside hydrolase family 57 protein, partial [bacterium]|nr:glycoside hydrolase family 57 protein [bacterium]
MHQPYYKDILTGEFLLPWVRLHATKDYYDMAALLDNFPGIRQTFNVVPSLLAQIDDYAKGEGTDRFLQLSKMPASELDDRDRHFILCNFFLAHWDNMIKPYPRYWEILKKRGFHRSKEELEALVEKFSDDEMRDLQFLFNLCWFDPIFIKEDSFLADMAKKGRGYSEEEKLTLLAKQKEIVGMVIPNYKRLAREGRIELTTTPFYHPILPLLCDTNIASKALPDIKLPKFQFSHPDDAREQIKRGISFHKKTFGSSPSGMWPSEGSVSEECLAMIASSGIEWVATDEEILEASTHCRVHRGEGGATQNPEFLYKPYVFNAGGKDITMIFRDHQLSDLIGFVYSSWEPQSAAADFMGKLHDIRRSLGDVNKNGDYIVPVILDGENCWEHYLNDGWDFLTNLYQMVEEDHLIEMVTVSEHLKAHPPKARLSNVFPGSWINHNFRIWIGHDEDNLAWDYLKETRDVLTEAEKEGKLDRAFVRNAWEHIYIAEGSDWCWWYGDEHSTENDADFDMLFRKNLINVYKIIGKEVPPELFVPIINTQKHIAPEIEAVSYINPTVDGEVSNYFEWLGAAEMEQEKTGGTMHKASFLMSRFYYGFNKQKDLYMRIDLGPHVQ